MVQREKLVRLRFLVPNAVTLGNIALGFLGVVAATEGRYERACVLVFLAALCDLFDGRLARMLDATSRFGMELDSLSDVISFGIAPALLLYLSVLRELGAIGMVVAVGFVLCAAARLARFNVETRPIADLTFLGCPVPIAGGYLLSLVLVRRELPPWGIGVGAALLALAMVSNLKVPKFRRGRGLPFALVLGCIALFVALLLRPGALTWHAWNGWNLIIVAANYVMLARAQQAPRGAQRPRQ